MMFRLSPPSEFTDPRFGSGAGAPADADEPAALRANPPASAGNDFKDGRLALGGTSDKPPANRADTPRGNVIQLASRLPPLSDWPDSGGSDRQLFLQDQDFAALCFALLCFCTPVVLGAFFLTVLFAFFE